MSAALPLGWQGASRDPWAETTWLESFLAEEREFSAPLAMPAPEAAALAVAAELAAAVRIAIEQVPVGARVQTRNPRRWEYDDSLPEPDEATWAKLSLTVQRSDGGLVDAELLRPRAWIELHGLRAGQLLPLHLAELEVSGPALVTAIEACPPIASGAGSVVTARFVTREVHRLVSVDLLGAGGELETLTGTPVHPVWSLDRGDWVPLAELTEGETLQGHTGPAIVLHLALHQAAQPVYNLEIHGEHVYQVGELGVLVHNNCAPSWSTTRAKIWRSIAESELENPTGRYSRTNLRRMLEGKPARVRVEVTSNRTGLTTTREVSMELHHRSLPQRLGTPTANESWNLEPVYPWSHESMDKFRHTGYRLLKMLNGPNSF